MQIASIFFVAIVAILHFYFMTLEMYFWTKPLGLKAFGQSKEQAESSKTLAANQGLYNGFLGAGLIWGLCHPRPEFGCQVQAFFLICIIIAGVYGGATAGKKILLVQALPAVCALILLNLAFAVS
jgi:putative membrane protein